MKNKKGFTLVELLAVIIILGIVMGIAAVSYNSYVISSRKKYYEAAAVSMKGAAESMIVFCNTHLDTSFCTKDSKNIGSFMYKADTVTITLDELEFNGFMEHVANKSSNDGSSCIGSVVVTTTGNTVGWKYNVKLECSGDVTQKEYN